MTGTVFLYLAAVCMILLSVCTRLSFLASSRLGAAFYYSNVINETFIKYYHLPRSLIEITLLLVGVCCLSFAGPVGWMIGVSALGLVAGLDLKLRFQERRILCDVYAHQDSRRSPDDQNRTVGGGVSVISEFSEQQTTAAAFVIGAYPDPSPHPDLIVNLNAPFVRRWPHYDLGDILLGRVINLEVIVGNHSIVPSQVPTMIEIQSAGKLAAEPLFGRTIPPQPSGNVFRGVVRLTARGCGGRGHVSLSVSCGDKTTTLDVRYRSIFPVESAQIVNAEITRYANASRAAFAWRGDMDHYDTSTFQSIEGLTQTLGLATRYRFPQTMYLSARLTLLLQEAREFYGHFGVERGEEEIPRFISWIRDNVDLHHQLAYPFDSGKPYAIELGNHNFLHYGTDAAAAPGNGWKIGARMGDGDYEWLGTNKDSLAEQRDNALAARQLCVKLFDFAPRSWAMPDSTKDQYTPAAMEAAGCQVLSDSDGSHKDNVLFQPPPHHPAGSTAVELTKRYPGDPENIFHLGMIQYWMHRAHRRGLPIIFMCHQHMRQYSGHGCSRFTEYILRYALTGFNGDLHINTVYGVGIYWNEVFSPQNRKVYIEQRTDAVVVRNTGQVNLSAVPVDLFYQDGELATVLIDLPPKSAFKILPDGVIKSIEG